MRTKKEYGIIELNGITLNSRTLAVRITDKRAKVQFIPENKLPKTSKCLARIEEGLLITDDIFDDVHIINMDGCNLYYEKSRDLYIMSRRLSA